MVFWFCCVFGCFVVLVFIVSVVVWCKCDCVLNDGECVCICVVVCCFFVWSGVLQCKSFLAERGRVGWRLFASCVCGGVCFGGFCGLLSVVWHGSFVGIDR